MDFAENYTCTAQDEIQSAHWNQNQVTLFTTVTWMKGKVVSKVVVSDFMQHTKTAVVVFLDEILQNIPIETEDLPASSKIKFVMEAMRMLSERYGIQLSWNFSATSHGKGMDDGIGGCLKRIATEKVQTRQCIIMMPRSFLKLSKDPELPSSSSQPKMFKRKRHLLVSLKCLKLQCQSEELQSITRLG